MKLTRYILLSFFYVLSASFTYAETKPIRIGATVSLEGKYREISAYIQNGYKLWESQVNRRGGLLGRPVQLVLRDDKSDEKLVRLLYEKLIKEDKVDLVLSPYSTPLTLVASEVSERHGFVMLASGSAGSKIWERGFKMVFGMYAPASRYFIGLLDLMARNGFRTLGIIHENTPFNIEIADNAHSWANRLGLKVILNKDYRSGETELSALLKEAKALNPDGLLMSGYSEDGYLLLDLMKEMKFRPRVIAITITPTFPVFYNKVGNMAEGVFAPSQWEADERIPFPGSKNFLYDYRFFTGTTPTYHAGSAYASCQIMEKAIIHNNSLDNDKIRDFVSSLDTVTVIGRFKVDDTGKQIAHNPLLIQWQNGKKEIVYPIKMQTAQPKF